MEKVVIAGAGIIGLSTAYALSNHEVDITILEGNETWNGCSYGNAGLLVPSHFVTLPAPGVIGKALRWMMDPGSPFSIKASLFYTDPVFLLRFARFCSHSYVNRHMELLKNLHLSSRELYLEWKKDLGGLELETRGITMLYGSKKGEREENILAGKARSLGIPVEVMDRQQLEMKEPGLRFNVRGGVHYPLDAHLNPAKWMHALRSELVRKGVHIVNGRPVDGFEKNRDRILAARSGKHLYEADHFVLATGIWSSTLAKSVGTSLPVQPGKGYSFNMKNPDEVFQVPKLINEEKVTITPIDGMVRFGGTMMLGDRTSRISKGRLKGIVQTLNHYFPEIQLPEIEDLQPWSGLRPVTPDGLPYIGPLSSFPNLIIGTGHAMTGISLGAITGKIISDLVCDKDPGIDLSALHPERFK